MDGIAGLIPCRAASFKYCRDLFERPTIQNPLTEYLDNAHQRVRFQAGGG
jgi:hypothetical protein